MKLEKIIESTIYEYLFEQKIQSKNSNLNDELWYLINSKYFMNWSNNWSDVLLDENNEPEIFYRGISLWDDEEIVWKFSKSFFTKDKSYAQNYAINHDDGSTNKDLVFSFFLKSKNILYLDDYSYGVINISSNSIKNNFIEFKDSFKNYQKFLSDFKKADIVVGDEDGSKNYSYYVKNDKNVLPIKKLIEFVKKSHE